MQIRLTTAHRRGRIVAIPYRRRRVARWAHQQELAALGSEEAIAGRDKVLSWTQERRDAFWSWAQAVNLFNPFEYVEEFESAFPDATERTIS